LKDKLQLEQWSVSKKPITFIDEFLDLKRDLIKYGPKSILDAKINLNKERTKEKIQTTIQIAKPNESKEIASIFKELYCNTYPYKRMEDAIEIQKRIEESKTEWTVYKTDKGKIVGCFGGDLDFGLKKALLHGFVIRSDYHHIIDVLKASVVSFLYFWYSYRKQKHSWFGEVRTYSSVPQWGTAMYGLRPIAFLPNKDVFFEKIESEFLHAAYDKEIIRSLRSRETPKIILSVTKAYAFTTKKYKLGYPNVINPKIDVDKGKVIEFKAKIEKEICRDKYDILNIKLNLANSFFRFEYNPYSNLIEKTYYKVKSLEELKAFLLKIKEFIITQNINYFQCFVSGYRPEEQQLFYNMGFKPRGYVPCWQYNPKKKVFEDSVLFNYYSGKLSDNLQLIPESQELLEMLGFFEEESMKEIFF
jgi:hypothetical protein